MSEAGSKRAAGGLSREEFDRRIDSQIPLIKNSAWAIYQERADECEAARIDTAKRLNFIAQLEAMGTLVIIVAGLCDKDTASSNGQGPVVNDMGAD